MYADIQSNDSLRGVIVHTKRKRQLFDFSGLRYDNKTGTDIDLFMEMDNEIFLFYEFKYVKPGATNREMPYGQQLAMKRLIDALSDAGKVAVLFLCEHSVTDTETQVHVEDCFVEKYYYNKKEYLCHNRPLKEITDGFMNFIKTRKAG